MTDEAVLSEQLDYYRARAGEYDEWWLRQGRFDRGAQANARWFAEAGALEAALARFDPRGDVLELACGTGLWTRRLVDFAGHVTAVDASPEVLAINRGRVGDPTVTYVEADLFGWAPPAAAFDVCVFTFWLSHVPADRFAAFWQRVAAALRPDGRVFFIDSARTERSTAADHRLPGPGPGPGPGEPLMTRRLHDGREFQIVKRFYEPRALESELAVLGWDCHAETTGEFFIHGTATRAG